MPKLTITRGWPGSGKSTWARAQDGVRVNRDDLRVSMYNKSGVLSGAEEAGVSRVQKATATALLKSGVNVIVDDTNLTLRYAREWATLAKNLGVEFEVKDFHVSLSVCILRDAQRRAEGGRGVGEVVIRNIAKRFPTKVWKEVLPLEDQVLEIQPYEPDLANLPTTYIFDIDGTLADMGNRRGPFEFDKVDGDKPVEAVVMAAHALHVNGCKIVVMSGRDDSCEALTRQWLDDWAIPYDALFMRKTGDRRKDSIMKLELFDKHVRYAYNVVGVFDDRTQVVEMWRTLGIPCFQVAPGDF